MKAEPATSLECEKRLVVGMERLAYAVEGIYDIMRFDVSIPRFPCVCTSANRRFNSVLLLRSSRWLLARRIRRRMEVRGR